MARKSRTPECHSERKHLARGLCKPCYDAQYHKEHREQHNTKAREWAARNPERRLAIRRRYHYGIEPDVVQARLNAQDGLCKICRIAPAVHLDHNHKTGQTRGLLCGNCNRGLGLFKEDVEILNNAIFYLGLWDDRCIQVVQNTGEPVPGQVSRTEGPPR